MTRRSLMLAGFVPVVSCAEDPTIDQHNKVAPRLPTTPAQQIESIRVERAIEASIESRGLSQAWMRGQHIARSDHLDRLTKINPLVIGSKTVKDVPVQANETSPKDALTHYKNEAMSFLQRSQPMALFYASLAASALDFSIGQAPPVKGGIPRPFAPATETAVIGVVVDRIHALYNGLEVGIGRAFGTPLAQLGKDRLVQVRERRDSLAHRSKTQRKVVYAFKPMNAPDQIMAAWASLELDVLAAWGRLFAASKPETAAPHLDAMLAQVKHVQAWHGALPVWPGWVNTP